MVLTRNFESQILKKAGITDYGKIRTWTLTENGQFAQWMREMRKLARKPQREPWGNGGSGGFMVKTEVLIHGQPGYRLKLGKSVEI